MEAIRLLQLGAASVGVSISVYLYKKWIARVRNNDAGEGGAEIVEPANPRERQTLGQYFVSFLSPRAKRFLLRISLTINVYNGRTNYLLLSIIFGTVIWLKFDDWSNWFFAINMLIKLSMDGLFAIEHWLDT